MFACRRILIALRFQTTTEAQLALVLYRKYTGATMVSHARDHAFLQSSMVICEPSRTEPTFYVGMDAVWLSVDVALKFALEELLPGFRRS